MKRFLIVATLVLCWSSLLFASAAISTVSGGSYTGTVSIPSGTVPTGATSAGISIECSAWTDTASSAIVTLETSQDGGLTWMPWCAGAFNGGTKNMQGQPLTNATMGGSIPQTPGLQIRGTIVVSGTPLVTQGITVSAGN